jgi:hypothetical protein
MALARVLRFDDVLLELDDFTFFPGYIYKIKE